MLVDEVKLSIGESYDIFVRWYKVIKRRGWYTRAYTSLTKNLKKPRGVAVVWDFVLKKNTLPPYDSACRRVWEEPLYKYI